eukprot:GILJ01006209.1.p1 GENE.GILJ01006209.1~~GILJ01006209.1.p1  ORF type:complete len:175 (+),score=23.38 GILJ01006209.1:185-709(+)
MGFGRHLLLWTILFLAPIGIAAGIVSLCSGVWRKGFNGNNYGLGDTPYEGQADAMLGLGIPAIFFAFLGWIGSILALSKVNRNRNRFGRKWGYSCYNIATLLWTIGFLIVLGASDSVGTFGWGICLAIAPIIAWTMASLSHAIGAARRRAGKAVQETRYTTTRVTQPANIGVVA